MPAPLSYREALELYKNVPRKESLAEWAGKMNQLTGTDRYAAAQHDPLGIKRGSATLDELLEATGIPKRTESLGRDIGEVVGDPEAGARVGHGLLRGAVNFAPLLIPGGGIPGAIAKFGATGALTGAETYTETGSPTAGVLSGLAAVAMPPAAGMAERAVGQYALKKLGGRLVEGQLASKAGIEAISQYFPKTAGQNIAAKTAGYTAGQVAAAGVGQLGTTATQLATGEPVTSPFTTENLLANTLGQAPFAAIHAVRTGIEGRGRPSAVQEADLMQHAIDASEPMIAAYKAKIEQERQPDVSKIPEVKQPDELPAAVIAETEARLAGIRGAQQTIKDDPNLSEPEKLQKINDLLQRESETLKRKQKGTQTVFGNKIVPEQPRQELIGRQVWINAQGTHRRILVTDDPRNPPELQNTVIGYSTLNEPAPVLGAQTQQDQTGRYSLPDKQWQTEPKPAFAYFERKNTLAKRATAEQVKLEKSVIDPAVQPLVNALNGKDVFTSGSTDRSVTVNNAYVDESRLPPQWHYDPDTETLTKSATVTDQGPIRPDEIQPIVSAISPRPREKITVGQPEGQPAVQVELPVRETPMTDEELNNHLHEIEKITVSADNAETPLDGQRAVVELNDVESSANLPLTDDSTLRPIMNEIAKADVIPPDKVPKAAVTVAAKLAARKLKEKQKALRELELSQARGEEAPATFEELPGKAEQEAMGEVAARFGADEGQAGFSVRDLSHLSHGDDKQIHDMIAEEAYSAVSKGVDAVKVFNKWNKDEFGDEKTTLVKDAKDFYDITGNFDVTKLPYEEVAKFLNDRTGSSTWDEYEVSSFMIRPHVQMWLKAMNEGMQKKTNQNAEHIAMETGIPAGGGFVFGLKPMEQIQNLPKSGIMLEKNFKNHGSFSGAFSDTELEFMKSLVPEAFSEGNVDVNKLQEGLRKNGPVVEIKKLGAGAPIKPGSRDPSQVIHDLDTHGYTAIDDNGWHLETAGGEPVDPAHVPAQVRDLFHELMTLSEDLDFNEWSVGGTGRFAWLGPKDPEDMPGYVEGIVRLPFRQYSVRKKGGGYIDKYFNTLEEAEKFRKEQGGVEVSVGTKPGSTLYTEQHFDGEGINALVHFRGYEETLPNGEKAFNVIELQSTWAQMVRDRLEELKTGDARLLAHNMFRVGEVTLPEEGLKRFGWTDKGLVGQELLDDVKKFVNTHANEIANQPNKLGKEFEGYSSNHPLLEGYNSLGLKAAIKHAQSIGATKLILPDSVTAMMTQLHDKTVATKLPAEEVVKRLNTQPGIDAGITEVEPVAGEKRRVIQIKTARGTTEELIKPGEPISLTAAAHDTSLTEMIKLFPDARPEQEGGMQLNYDKLLPSAAEKLTKSKPEMVDLGIHDKATSRQQDKLGNASYGGNDAKAIQQKATADGYLNVRQDAAGDIWGTRPGSPMFKNEQGQPENRIKGRMYDLAQVPNEFTLMGRSREGGVPQVQPRWEREPNYIPKTSGEMWTATMMGFDQQGRGDGHGIIDYLKNHKDPFYQGMARDLANLGSESLSRVSMVLRDSNGSYLRQLSNRRAEISVSRNALNGSTDYQAYILAHELIHGLTSNEMDNPLKGHIVRELDLLRQQLITKLPARISGHFDALRGLDWYRKYGNGEVSGNMNEALGLTGKDRLTVKEHNILYGLMTTKEMVAQGMTVKNFREFMQGVPAMKGVNVFTRMTNFVKSLLGLGEKVSDTAFEQFLAHTDQLIEAGDYVSSFMNYSNRYFERLGQPEAQVEANTSRAIGIINDSIFGTDPAGILAQIRFGTMRNPEMQQSGRALTQMIQERGDAFASMTGVMDEVGLSPNQSGIEALATRMMMGDTPNHHDVLDTLPPEAANHIFAVARDAKQILGVIHEATKENNRGVNNIAEPKMLHGPVTDLVKSIDKVLAHEQAQQEYQAIVDAWEGVPPSGHMANIVANPDILPEWAMGADRTKKKENFVHYVFEPIAQWARRVPEIAEVVAKGFQLDANSRKMASEGLKPFGMDLTTMDMSKESVKSLEQVLKIPKLTRAADQWIWTNQKAGREGDAVSLLDATHPDIAKILAPLNTREREQVEDLVQKHQISQQQTQAQVLEKMLQIASTRGAEVAGGKVADGVKLASTLIDAVRADRSDPAAARIADDQISMVRAGMQPKEFLNLLKYTQSVVGEWNAMKELYQKNPAWSSGQRYGKYLVTYLRGKKPFKDGVNSRKEAEALAKGGTIVKFELNQKADADAAPNLGPDSPGMVKRLREFQQNQYDILLNSGRYTQDDIAAMKASSPIEAFISEEAYKGGVPGLRPQVRGLTMGAQELPWLRNHFSWVKKTSTYWSRQLLRAQVHAHLLDPEISANPELQKKLQVHFDNMLTPDTQVGHFFQRAAMNWFMGFNPASALINATQPFLTHTAEFTAMTGKPVDSYRRTIGALKDVGKYYASGKKSWGDADLDWAMHKSAQDGEIDLAMFDDDAATQEAVHTNYKRIMDGQRTQTLGQKLSTMSGSWSTAGMWMFRGVERMNTMAALLSSFKYYKEQGFTKELALEKAYEFNHAVNYGGGRAQRPVGIFAGRGVVPRTAAMLATSMQSYVLGTTFQLGRYIQKGFFRPEGLAPGEVYAARKAAVQMLSVQLMSAGVLGMPFVSGAVAALNALFPDLEVRRHLQEWMNEILGGDKENGNILADAAMMGVPSMFGWDLQSRLSMGNTVPGVSEVNGFDPELLLGAPVNMVSSFVKGGQQLTQGDISGIDKFTPPALKKISQYARQGGIATDYRDRPIFTPTKGEVAGMALGFQPRRATNYNTASRIAKQAQDSINRRKSEFHQQMGQQVLKGNFGNVRGELLKRTREDKNFDAAGAVRSIAESAEALTFTRDLRREGTVDSGDVRARLLRSFNIPPSQPDETARLQFRQGVEQRLGLPVSTGNDLLLAQVMDQLRRQQPGVSRSELRRAAERLLRGPRQQTVALPQE